jgi:beta-ureidopropionase / N-carbamoyl-L-amino-acid hydrolase
MHNLTINAERLSRELMETAAIGATPKGGICRLTLTDLDRQARDWFKERMETLGCTVTVDDMGAMR